MSLLPALLLILSLCFNAAADNSAGSTFYSALKPCPNTCSGGPDDWTVYSSTDRFKFCNQSLLLDFNIFNPLSDQDTPVKIRTCTTQDGELDNGSDVQSADGVAIAKQDKSTCTSSKKPTDHKVTVRVRAEPGVGPDSTRLQSLLKSTQEYLTSSAHCAATFQVGLYNGLAVGLYAGQAMDKSTSLPRLLEDIVNKRASTAGNSAFEVCDQDRSADQILGAIIDTSGDLSKVQDALSSWSNAVCLTDSKNATQSLDLTVSEIIYPVIPNNTFSMRNTLWPRSNCRTITVVSGDGCGSLASKCGISGATFTKYNPSKSLCSTLAPGQRVCCSSGTLPDIRPKPDKYGNCAKYNVKSGDTCAALAASNGLKVADIATFNDKTTWGWTGCKGLMAGTNICLSKGKPPRPAAVANAVCGPIKPGATLDSSNIGHSAPCPLNACCDIWGQCGITPEFCTVDKGPTGNPGTARPGHNGCISNCGTTPPKGAVNNHPTQVGYYESWSWQRSCVHMNIDTTDTSWYNHVHWAFGTVTSDFKITISDPGKQFANFKKLNAKRIISLGGWSFSTDLSSYSRLRTAMDPKNVDKFVANIVSFINSNGIDGIDIDWEYPGAPDIPGIPAGLKTDGPNYLKCLQKLRKALGSSKSISIAAPASYWYLKAFPIAEMSKVLDYIVYMTYDMHGQWDYSNHWSQEGCPTGNCLRSHVNLTETNYALAMISKAGVPQNKILVGIANYGRSFKMTKSGCTGPSCTFTGPKSGAFPGECTETAGYISQAEIMEIQALGKGNPKTFSDGPVSGSYIMVYNDTQWVSYLSESQRFGRSIAAGLNGFGGFADWAIDLTSWGDDNTSDGDGSSGDDLESGAEPLPECDQAFRGVADLDALGDIPDNCREQYVLVALEAEFLNAYRNFTNIMGAKFPALGYDSAFKIYSKAVAKSAGQTVHDWMYKNGNKYFTCVVTEMPKCCSGCKGNDCKYCYAPPCHDYCPKSWCVTKRGLPEDDWSVDSDAVVNITERFGGGTPPRIAQAWYRNFSEPCPPDFSQRGDEYNNGQAVYWTMIDSKSKQFYADILTDTGITQAKLGRGDFDRGGGCSTDKAQGQVQCDRQWMDHDIPVPSGYSAGDVTNPKDTVQKALDSSNNWGPTLSQAISQVATDTYDGDATDLIDTVSIPILMISQGVDMMHTVINTAEKILDEEFKQFILTLIGAILLVVPFIGEALGSIAEIADLVTVLSVAVDVGGNAALDIYDIVKNPQGAIMSIFSLLLAPLGLLDIAKVARAAQIRRGMSEADLVKLGTRVGDGATTIKKVLNVCARK